MLKGDTAKIHVLSDTSIHSDTVYEKEPFLTQYTTSVIYYSIDYVVGSAYLAKYWNDRKP